jgi:hypothetical protein
MMPALPKTFSSFGLVMSETGTGETRRFVRLVAHPSWRAGARGIECIHLVVSSWRRRARRCDTAAHFRCIQHFSNPGTTFAPPRAHGFGVITGAGTPRQLQLWGVHFAF